MAYRLITTLLYAGLLFSSTAHSGQNGHRHHHEYGHHANHHVQHGSHVHGEARLMVAVDGGTLAIELNSPAMNIVGFEHQPKNAAQRKAIQGAVDALQKPADLFTLPASANCQHKEVEVDAPHADEPDQAHQHGHDTETHTEFVAHYHFACADITLLQSIEVHLIKQFPGIQEIEVQLIAPSGQRKLALTAVENQIDL